MTKLSQLRILVDDFPESFRFYREILGLLPQSEEQASGPYACFKAEDGSTDLALFDRAIMAKSVGAAYTERGSADLLVVVFRVKDVDAEYEKAVADGAESVSAPAVQQAWGMRVAHLRAPEGTLIEFCSY